jgi:hypothetical protein
VFRFFSTAVLSNEIYLPTKFHVDISNSFRVMPRTRSKSKQRAITSKEGKAELCVFSTTLFPNETHLPTKCHVDISYDFRVITRTKFKVPK